MISWIPLVTDVLGARSLANARCERCSSVHKDVVDRRRGPSASASPNTHFGGPPGASGRTGPTDETPPAINRRCSVQVLLVSVAVMMTGVFVFLGRLLHNSRLGGFGLQPYAY